MKKRALQKFDVRLFFSFYKSLSLRCVLCPLLILMALFDFYSISGCSPGNQTNLPPTITPDNNTDLSSTNDTNKNPSLQKTKENKLHIVVSDTLTGLIEKLKTPFLKKNKTINLKISTSPESLLENKVKNNAEATDLILSTDYKSLQLSLLANGLCDFVTIFATDEIIICRSNKSTSGDKISTNNWQWILSQKKISFGHVNPNTDICGRKTMMTWELADNYYRANVKGRKIKENMMAPKGRKMVRPSQIQLLPLLATGTIDFIFIYRSLAEQHNLPYTRLRPEYNLSKWKYRKRYSKVKYNDQIGEPISLSFTICNKSKNQKTAGSFANFILSSEGRKIITNAGLTPLSGGATLFTTSTLDIPLEKWDN